MTALLSPVMLMLLVFGVDVGALYTERRETQFLSDLAAIAGAANIDNANAAVGTALSDNGFTDIVVQSYGQQALPTKGHPVAIVALGQYVADPSVAAGSRFQRGKQPYNAVNVTLHKIGTLHFADAFFSAPVIGAGATANTASRAMFSVGSRLASVNDGILNALLGKLVGGNVALNAMDYRALIAADVNVFSFLNALATRLNITGGTYSDVLKSQATVGQVADAIADISGLDNTAKLALKTLGRTSTTTARIPVSRLVDLGTIGNLAIGQAPAGLSADANVMGLLSMAGVVAGGANQIKLDLGATIPGLTATTVEIAIGEPEQFSSWLAIGGEGTVVRTAQTRIKLLASVGVNNPNLGGGIKLLTVKLPLQVEVASAEARLAQINCAAGNARAASVDIDTRPGVASLHIGESSADGFADFSDPQSFSATKIAEVSVKLLFISLDLLSVNGQSDMRIGNTNPTRLHFNSVDIANKVVKTASTRNVTQSLTTSLVNGLSLSISVAGLGLDVTALLGTIRPAIVSLLSGVSAPVDDLLYNLLSVLGVRIGEADVRVTDAICGRSVLVQ